MEFDPNPDLRTELIAALAAITPQIEGLEVFMRVVPQFRDFFKIIEKAHKRLIKRRNLINDVIVTLDAVVAARAKLAADGYPGVDLVRLTPDIFEELQEDIKDFEAGAAMFEALPGMTISMGIPENKI